MIEPEKPGQEQQKMPIKNAGLANMANRIKARLKEKEKQDIGAKINATKEEIVVLSKRLDKLLAEHGHKFVGDLKNDPSVPQKIKDKAEVLYREKDTKERIELAWFEDKRREAKQALRDANKFLKGEKTA